MRFLYLTLIYIISISQGFTLEHENSFQSYRTLMIFSPDVQYISYREQLILLSRDPIGLDQRKISILEIFPIGGIEADGSIMDEDRVVNLRKEYKISDADFRIILLGETGDVKLNISETITDQALFKLIDEEPEK